MDSEDSDSLPAVHPTLLNKISSPPFEYSSRGLTFNSHPRASIADLKQGLFPKRKNAAPLKQNKDWWLAQLRLYGIDAKASTRKEELLEALKGALSRGLVVPSKEILQLEQKLERKFAESRENAEARVKKYATLSEEERASKHSERYLREKFRNGTDEEKMVALDIGSSFSSKARVQNAAKKLGLHCESARGRERRIWTIIGKEQSEVRKRKADIDKEFHDWEAEERDVKRRKVEIRRQECDAGGAGCFKDVEGEWIMECPKMDKEYSELCRGSQKSMSIFFHKPYIYHNSDSEDDDEDEHNTSKVNASPMLCANFKMGIFEGMLRSKGDLPAQSSSFPAPTVPFTWRGEETGNGEIQLDYEGNRNVGSFSFVSKTQVNGTFRGGSEKWTFTGCKVAKAPADTEDKWEDFRGRWR